MYNLKQKKILITGGSSGIGKSVAECFVDRQADICILSRDKCKLEAVLNVLNKHKVNHEQIISIQVADVSDRNQVEDLVPKILKTLNGIDIIVNCAGISRPGYVLELPADEWESMIKVNYFGSVNVCLAFLPYLIKNRSGHIINISSAAGYIGLFGYAAYSASKFALVGFSESLRQEVKAFNINVSLVYPPDTNTPMLAKELKYQPIELKKISNSVKVLSPEEVAISIVKGIQKRKRNIIPGCDNKMFFLLNRYFPSLLKAYIDLIIQRHRIIPSSNEINLKK